MKKLALILVIILAFSSTVWAIHDYYVSDPPYEGYTGERARIRRLYDPFSRDRNFGEAAYKPYVNYGSKGPPYRATNTGAKSAYSGVFQLDSSDFIPRGRDPSKISNRDPRMRGFNIVDISVDLLPYSPVQQVVGTQPLTVKGTARIVGRGDIFGATLNQPFPETKVFISAINLPPVEPTEAYEAWLIDDETEYAVNLGVLDVVTELTLGLTYENPFFAHYFDHVMITKEAFPDPDPSPGEIILMGAIGDSGPTRELRSPAPFIFQRLR